MPFPMNVPPIWRAVVEAHERELLLQKVREPSLPFPPQYGRIAQQVQDIIAVANGRNSQEP